MSVAIAFFVESRQPCGLQIKTEEWLSVARGYDVDRMLVIDRTNKACFSPDEDPEHPAEVFVDFDAIVAANPDARYVMLERTAPDPIVPTALPDYTHPTSGDVIYCFGPDSGGLQGLNPPNADWVVIPMSDATRWGLWAIMAATLVMQDRWRSIGDNG